MKAFAAILILACAACAVSVPTPSPAGPHGTVVVLTAGQSNMAALAAKGDWSPDAMAHPGQIRFAWDGEFRGISELWTRMEEKGGPWSHRQDKPYAQITSLALADALIEAGEADEVILVPCAVGGSSIVEWLPDPEQPARPGTLFGNCLRAARLASSRGELRALFFHQGESDARDWVRGSNWERLARTVFISFRDELKRPDLPIILGRLGDLSNDPKPREWLADVVAAQDAITLPCMAKVETMDLPLSADNVHFSAAGQIELGRRYVRALMALEPAC